MIELFFRATLETVLMVTLASMAGLLFGLPLGILLWGSTGKGLWKNKALGGILGFFINSIRSTPYIILMVALIPVTRLIVGSSIGTLAATVPLSLASIMIYARLSEEVLAEISPGVLEAALSFGATKWQLVTRVLIPESLPGLIGAFTFLVINLIGFSAMAGALGGGGLGDLGIRYGYQRYQIGVIAGVIVILLVMVQGVQLLGSYWSKKARH